MTNPDASLCFLSAKELTTLVSNREISALDVVEAHLQRIESVNNSINAIVTYEPELARTSAKALDSRMAKKEPVGLLAGLPVAHKDLIETRGIRTTFGSRLYQDYVPLQNSLLVDRIQGQDAITVGKTNTPEFGAGSHTFNEVFGTTFNPFDRSKSAGGSSGGAAAALAARLVPLADGSDMGGSLRNPASFCNVVGIRTTPGVVPAYPADMAWNCLPILGPMARNVEDCALFLAAITGSDTRAPLSLYCPPVDFQTPLERDFAQTRVALSTDFGGQLPVDPEVRETVEAAAAVFKDLGCTLDDACPDFSQADSIFKTLRSWSMAARHKESLEQHPELYKQTLAWNIKQGLMLSQQDLSLAEKARSQLHVHMAQFFESYDFLILPTVQVTPFEATIEFPTRIAGQTMETYIDWMKSCYFISATICPAISIPAGFTSSGLPVGIQIVGRPFKDLGVLQLAYAFERATGYYRVLPTDLPDLSGQLATR